MEGILLERKRDEVNRQILSLGSELSFYTAMWSSQINKIKHKKYATTRTTRIH